jgi:putative oxidoreductase
MMPTLFVIGRVLFVLIFILSGMQKLMDLPGTAAMIVAKIPVPAALAGLAAQIESATGMPIARILAVLAGIVELLGGVMIAFNFGTRFAALMLLAFTIAATVAYHDFWNQEGAERANNMAHALKNVSLVGGLLVFFVLGSWRPLRRPPAAAFE